MMDDGTDFEDRLAARLLGVPIEADVAAIRGRFRSLVKAVHPDRNVMDACIDIGTLAEAKDRLLRRAEERIARDAAPVQGQSYLSTAWAPKSSVLTARFEPVTKVGALVDLAG